MNRNDLVEELAFVLRETSRQNGVTVDDTERAEAVVKALEHLDLFPPNLVNLPEKGISLKAIERQALIEALKASKWWQVDAADLLKITPAVINYKIKSLGIQLQRRQSGRADRAHDDLTETAEGYEVISG